jgi:hypothetical protein
MATIRKRGSRWEAQIRRRGVPTETRSFSHKVDAVVWSTTLEAQVERGEFQNRICARQTEFSHLIERYRHEVSIHKKGHSVEIIRLSALARSPLAACRLDQVNAQVGFYPNGTYLSARS